MKIQYRRDLWQLLIGRDGNVAEVGVAEGNFSCDMLRWPVSFPRLYLVDRWKCTPSQRGDGSMPQVWHDNNLAQVHQKIAVMGAESRTVFLKGSSVDMAKRVPSRSLVLVYIDADHSYKAVKEDIRAWIPALVAGGYMAFHDYDNPNYGVKAAVKEFCESRRIPIQHIPEDKPEDAGAYFRWEGGSC